MFYIQTHQLRIPLMSLLFLDVICYSEVKINLVSTISIVVSKLAVTLRARMVFLSEGKIMHYLQASKDMTIFKIFFTDESSNFYTFWTVESLTTKNCRILGEK